MNQSDLRAAFAISNVRAFYDVIRKTESALDDSAYTLVNLKAPDDPARGVKAHHFSSFADHPYAGLKTTQGGYAAGAPQFIPSTWAGLVRQYGFADFSPPNQDLGYVGLLAGRGALEDVIAGRFETAVTKCLDEWSSLPAASESRQDWTMEKAKAFFISRGGAVAGGRDPRPDIPQGAPTPTLPTSLNPFQQKEPRMGAALALFAPILGELIPQIKSILNPQSEVAKRNTALLETIGNIIVKQSGATNMQDAVEKMQADQALKVQVQQAVVTEPAVMQTLQITEVGGGIAGARQADIATQQQEKPFWRASAVFWISVLLLPMVYWLVASIVAGGGDERLIKALGVRGESPPAWMLFLLSMFGDGWTGEARSGAFNLVIGLVLGGICGVYYGISVTQQRQQQPPAAIKE